MLLSVSFSSVYSLTFLAISSYCHFPMTQLSSSIRTMLIVLSEHFSPSVWKLLANLRQSLGTCLLPDHCTANLWSNASFSITTYLPESQDLFNMMTLELMISPIISSSLTSNFLFQISISLYESTEMVGSNGFDDWISPLSLKMSFWGRNLMLPTCQHVVCLAASSLCGRNSAPVWQKHNCLKRPE